MGTPLLLNTWIHSSQLNLRIFLTNYTNLSFCLYSTPFDVTFYFAFFLPTGSHLGVVPEHEVQKVLHRRVLEQFTVRQRMLNMKYTYNGLKRNVSVVCSVQFSCVFCV